MAIFPRSSLQSRTVVCYKSVSRRGMFRPFEGTFGTMSNDVIASRHGRQVQAYREYEVRCAGTPVDDPWRGKPSPCHRTGCVRESERCQSYTCAKSRSVLVSCRKVPLASQAPKRNSTTPQFGCLAAAFLRQKAGTNVKKPGADAIFLHRAPLLWRAMRQDRADGESESLAASGSQHRGDTKTPPL